MKYEKPNISVEEIQGIIDQYFHTPCDHLNEITCGEIARTYSFTVDTKTYYIQFTQENMSYGSRIEMQYYEKFQARDIPVRTVVTRNTFHNMHYAITEKVDGCQLQDVDEQTLKILLPKVYEAMINISTLEIEGTTGYGWLDEDGNGMFHSWKDHINFVIEEEPDDLFYGKWYDLFDKTFLEQRLYERYYTKMSELYEYLPEMRCFQHGNFSCSNILIRNTEIAAIIDWQDARYGDFLYDLTGFVFWFPDALKAFVINEFKDFYESTHHTIEHYFERISCYQYYLGLDALRFFAKTEKRDSYDCVVKILDGM